MRTSRIVIAIIVALIGLVWVAQGTGMIGGSAMSGSGFWAVVGIAAVAAAVAIVVLEFTRSARR